MKKILEATKIAALLISMVLIMSAVQAAFVNAQGVEYTSDIDRTQAGSASIYQQQTATNMQRVEIKLGDAETVNDLIIGFEAITKSLPLEANTATFRISPILRAYENIGLESVQISLDVGESKNVLGSKITLIDLKYETEGNTSSGYEENTNISISDEGNTSNSYKIVAVLAVSKIITGPGQNDIRVRLDSKFKLKPRQTAIVVDYKNMRIKYMAMAIPTCTPGNECLPFISFQAEMHSGDAGTATEFSLSPGHSKVVFGAKVSLADIVDGSIAVMSVSAKTKPTTSKLTVKAFDTNTGNFVDGAKAIVIRNVLVPRIATKTPIPITSSGGSGGGQSAPSAQAVSPPSQSGGSPGQLMPYVIAGDDTNGADEDLETADVETVGSTSGFLPITAMPQNISSYPEAGVLLVRVIGAIEKPYKTTNVPYVSGAEVVVYGKNAQPVAKGETGNAGSVRFRLKEGAYTVVAEKDKHGSDKQLTKVESGHTTEITMKLSKPIITHPRKSTKVVVGVINADGRDSIDLRRGVYNIIVFATDHSLFRQTIKVDGLRDYGLKAPLTSVDSTIEGIAETDEYEEATTETEFPSIGEAGIAIEGIAEKPTVTVVRSVNGREVVEISSNVEETEIETVSPTIKKPISIMPVAIDPSKLEIKSGDVAATTKGKLEIDKEKLYINSGNTKVLVKIVPEEAHRIARRGTGEVQDIELDVKENKAIYTIKKIQPANLFGFIPVQYDEETEVNAETGAVENVNAPFWATLTVPY